MTDLQGTLNEPAGGGLAAFSGYTLTDPCVLCTDRRRFGDPEWGNLGPDFMRRNLEACCRLLGVAMPEMME